MSVKRCTQIFQDGSDRKCFSLPNFNGFTNIDQQIFGRDKEGIDSKLLKYFRVKPNFLLVVGTDV